MNQPTLTFSCPNCGKNIRAKEELAGKKVRCPGCQNPLQIPSLSQNLAPTEIVDSTAESGQTPIPGDLSSNSSASLAKSSPLVKPNLPNLPGYEFLGELGRGGMGVVYRARQINLDRPVAIKSVHLTHAEDGKTLARFEKEALAVAKLRHPNIVTAFDFGQHEGQVYFVMELLDGENAEERIHREGSLGEKLTWGIIRQAAAGLAHAVQHGLIHRDIKPANLFLVPPPEGTELSDGLPLVKVTDFGLVWLTGEEDEASRLTRTGTVLGTPIYMAPEQFKGKDLDFQVDIYALGMTALHMLTGKAPYQGKTLWEIMTDKATGNIPLIPDKLSSQSRTLLKKMLAPDPENRIHTYTDLMQQIDQVISCQTKTLSPKTAETPTKQPPAEKKQLPTEKKQLPTSGEKPSRGYFLWGGGLALGLLAVVFGFLLMSGVFFPPATSPEKNRGPGPRQKPKVPSPHMKPVGAPTALFDGQNLNEWTIEPGSFWSITKDKEGGTVLSGEGLITRSFPNWDNFCISLGADYQEVEGVQIHFGFSADNSGHYYVLDMTPQKAYLKQANANQPPPTALSQPISLPPPSKASSAYQEHRVERQGENWFAFAQGKLIGTAPARGREGQYFRLATRGGTVLFESISITKLGR